MTEQHDDPDIIPGTVLADRFRLDQQRESAFTESASTWDATDLTLQIPVVVELCNIDDPSTPEVLDAAVRASRFADPRVVRVLNVVTQPVPFIVKEQRELFRVEDVIEPDVLGNRVVAPNLARAIVGSAAQIISDATKAGVRHLHVRTQNLFLDADGMLVMTGLGVDAAAAGIHEDLLLPVQADRREARGLLLLYMSLTSGQPQDRIEDSRAIFDAAAKDDSLSEPLRRVMGFIASDYGLPTPTMVAQAMEPWDNDLLEALVPDISMSDEMDEAGGIDEVPGGVIDRGAADDAGDADADDADDFLADSFFADVIGDIDAEDADVDGDRDELGETDDRDLEPFDVVFPPVTAQSVGSAGSAGVVESTEFESTEFTEAAESAGSVESAGAARAAESATYAESAESARVAESRRAQNEPGLARAQHVTDSEPSPRIEPLTIQEPPVDEGVVAEIATRFPDETDPVSLTPVWNAPLPEHASSEHTSPQPAKPAFPGSAATQHEVPERASRSTFPSHATHRSPHKRPSPRAQRMRKPMTASGIVIVGALVGLCVVFVLALVGILRPVPDVNLDRPTVSASPQPSTTTQAPSPTPEEATPSSTAPAPEIDSVTLLNPYAAALDSATAAKQDNPATLRRVIDSNPSTSWHSYGYYQPRFDSKPGFAIALKLKQAVPVSSVHINSSTPGGQVVWKDSQPDTPDQGTDLATASFSESTVLTPTSPVTTDTVILWVSQIPPHRNVYQLYVSEISVQ